MKDFDLNDFSEQELKNIRQVMREEGYKDEEATVKALLDSQINRGMGEMTGGAQTRQLLNRLGM